ncbi:bifunctional proline dehydrogenase/L-glutamate gamma-semialdehyde dehydrogenase [Saccharobesus litoralis]|uniref:Bifunctional protein PutA n=1 Tax=Saccharobesus litoralis TaxID=2172099 RepID=A0A2S0VND7_9ALTE|nr:bifunctional proline dehydrogenase/L-glutamate gamma-semialdehyde dehydrogenase PutA [Saccharobesus litoralis]AWB65738.1 bifunctional proline dehydrogenase/L-glutamate gamma-semialdehyde dehydrogenase [Saccharobesus litoralis]
MINKLLSQADYLPDLAQLTQLIADTYCCDEQDFIKQIALPSQQNLALDEISLTCEKIITDLRQHQSVSGIAAFLQEYGLSNQEGLVLMGLAEALLRIPDAISAEALIEDRLSAADWTKHSQHSSSSLVNLTTWGLELGSKVTASHATANPLANMLKRLGKPVIKLALDTAVKLMANQFILSESVDKIGVNSRALQAKGYCFSYDMLGEAAMTQADATRYLKSYQHAIIAVANQQDAHISVKLSALHPKFQANNQQQVIEQLVPNLVKLLTLANQHGVAITLDAEEADRLELTLAVFKATFCQIATLNKTHFGLAVQAYSKRAIAVIAWLRELARSHYKVIPVRLVKGAYWDQEIKHSQQLAISDYPVFTQKAATDINYLACAQLLFQQSSQRWLYPQFATHNVHTLLCIIALAKQKRLNGQAAQFECQRLYGMGQAIYDLALNHPQQLGGETLEPFSCRIYAPIGDHKQLLPYLVRRLLENGANSSFVHQLLDDSISAQQLSLSPFGTLTQSKPLHKPRALFTDRLSAAGINLNLQHNQKYVTSHLAQFNNKQWQAASLVQGQNVTNDKSVNVFNPAFPLRKIGSYALCQESDVQQAFDFARANLSQWQHEALDQRCHKLHAFADKLQKNQFELMSLLICEAGKTWQDAIDEIKEAIDFCHYYAQQAKDTLLPCSLQGVTGEKNTLHLTGRGLFLCISPWNFPLAIFVGQIAAALVCGNSVIAKPSSHTNLIAFRTTQLAYEVGIPSFALQLLLIDGQQLTDWVLHKQSIDGLCFTGSNQTAHHIQQQLTLHQSAIVPYIAETGGQNCLIADSTALPEQIVKDVIHSAFTSCGQRCSALRVLYIQNEIAEEIEAMLIGALQTLKIDDPSLFSSDIGPCISQDAQQALISYIDSQRKLGRVVFQANKVQTSTGYYVPPTIIKINSVLALTKEHFGPILHIVHFQRSELEQIIADINQSQFGLTLGIHSRHQSTIEHICQTANVGNIYINRNQIGAVVGSQPFGGRGLSGTGPKAGGPHYLSRFVCEKTISNNTAAMGGNIELLMAKR